MNKVRKISANYIFPVSSRPIKNGIIILDNKTITQIIDPGENFYEQANLEFYNGILIPAFVHDTFNKDNIEQKLISNYSILKADQYILDTIFAALNTNPKLSFEILLIKYTLSMAKSLQCKNRFGSLEQGKSPGILLISPFDFQKFTLKEESKIKRLV